MAVPDPQGEGKFGGLTPSQLQIAANLQSYAALLPPGEYK